VDLGEGPEEQRKSCTSVIISLVELHSFEEPSVTYGLEAFNAQRVDEVRNIDRTLGRVDSRRLVLEVGKLICNGRNILCARHNGEFFLVEMKLLELT
jgi:hypothetical protein